ncbi:hypothetical protein ACLK19_16470 [Escherichia coli]
MRQNRRYDFAHHPVVRASGFEHCIANLFVIPFSPLPFAVCPPPFGRLARVSADNFPALTVSHFFTANLLPGDAGSCYRRCSAGEYVLSGYLLHQES